jgi:hypothetical protein
LVEENNYAKEDPKEFGNNADTEQDEGDNSAKIVIFLLIIERSEFFR